MKKFIIASTLLLLSISGFSQNSAFEYTGRYTPTTKREKLHDAVFVTDILPEFWRHVSLPYNENEKFKKARRIYYAPDYTINDTDVEYVTIEISTISNGQVTLTKSSGNKLTTEQKKNLNIADWGTDISVKMKFKYKNEGKGAGDKNKIMEGDLTLTVVPETEAEFPGGFKQLSKYLTKTIFNKFPLQFISEKIQPAVVKFTIDNDGVVSNPMLLKKSNDARIDEAILNAINKMPQWIPAKNKMGVKIKQEFSIPFYGGGC